MSDNGLNTACYFAALGDFAYILYAHLIKTIVDMPQIISKNKKPALLYIKFLQSAQIFGVLYFVLTIPLQLSAFENTKALIGSFGQDSLQVDCLADTLYFCDESVNDNKLWNASYWWDSQNQSKDLGEASLELSISATGNCPAGDINISYQLFLDLDGDGVLETVVNSSQTGGQAGSLGWNNILYNNMNGPGESREFDGRLVFATQKWGFAIQETVTNNGKTAWVKFNTFDNQNSYETPQLPLGTHKIKWIVSDNCGNADICENTIIIKDCKAPVVSCITGLSVNIMPFGFIQLWATDFLLHSEDNNTRNPLLQYGIRKCGQGTGFPRDLQGNPITNVTFDCASFGTHCVELWSIDLAGNADFCAAWVVVADDFCNCDCFGGLYISGTLTTEMGEGIYDAEVVIAGTSTFSPPFSLTEFSDDDGDYAYLNRVPIQSNLKITPWKVDNLLNGVTTYDLVLISKHILGLAPLGSPYKMIAADANRSNSITTFDIVELRKLILGIYEELPNNNSWRFIDKSQTFANPANPFAEQLRVDISYSQLLANLVNQDFIGVKVGDVNNTAIGNSLMESDDRSVGTLVFDVSPTGPTPALPEGEGVRAGQEFEVSFTADQVSLGYQMTLNLDGLEVAEIMDNDQVTEGNFGVFADALTVSIDGTESFTLKFRATKAGKLSEMIHVSSRITKAEAYCVADGRMEVALRFDGKTITGAGFELYQNRPNPFLDHTRIGFQLPTASTATLTVYDAAGRVVFTQKDDFAKGYHAIQLDRALLNSTGVLYYTLETATDAATKKMIQAK